MLSSFNHGASASPFPVFALLISSGIPTENLVKTSQIQSIISSVPAGIHNPPRDILSLPDKRSVDPDPKASKWRRECIPAAEDGSHPGLATDGPKSPTGTTPAASGS